MGESRFHDLELQHVTLLTSVRALGARPKLAREVEGFPGRISLIGDLDSISSVFSVWARHITPLLESVLSRSCEECQDLPLAWDVNIDSSYVNTFLLHGQDVLCMSHSWKVARTRFGIILEDPATVEREIAESLSSDADIHVKTTEPIAPGTILETEDGYIVFGKNEQM